MKLAPHNIHLYSTFSDRIQDQQLLTAYQALLSDDEQQRYQNIKLAHHKHQFLLTRALVRCTLSRYVNKAPAAWQFTKNQYGRPEIIRQKHEPALRFNVSHSHDLIVCAIVLNDDIGVDIEYQQRKSQIMDIAQRFFAATEIKQLQQLSGEQQKQRFYELWTLKEAFIKACGMGLSLPLHKFSFNFDQQNLPQLHCHADLKQNPQHWQFWQFQPGQSYLGAIALYTEHPQKYQLHNQTVIPLQ